MTGPAPPSRAAIGAILAFILPHGVLAQALTLASPQYLPPAPPRVIVTGSRIAHAGGDDASLMTVLQRDDIAASGASTVRQVLDTLTFFDTGALRDDGSGASFARGASGASLRGLGKGATLVLLNGRRIASYGLADGGRELFTNLDTIGADAIERIEVLRDGASAVYGSDAMAGVINVITRRGHDGVSLSASAERAQRLPGSQRSAAITGGVGEIGRDGFHVLASLEAYQRKGYTQREVLHAYPAWHKRFVNPAFGEASIYSFPGNLNEPRADGHAAVRAAVASCPPERINSAGMCTSDLTGITQASDGADRVNFFSLARMRLPHGVLGFAELSWARTSTAYRALPYATVAGSPVYWFNGLLQRSESAARPRLSVGNPANPFPFAVGIDYRFMDDLDMWRAPARASQYRLLAGLEGTVADGRLGWEVALGQSGSSAATRDHGAHRDHFPEAVSSGEYVIGGPNSAALLARMFPEIGTDGKTAQQFADLKISGDAMRVDGGALAFAAGVELRRETMRLASSDNVMHAQIIGRGAQLSEGARNLAGLYLELDVPFMRRLDISAALRADKLQGFHGHLSPRLGVRYAVTPALQLRAGAGRGFRAPNIAEAQGKIGLTGFYNSTLDPMRCADATRLRDILAGGTSADKADAITAFNSGCQASVPAMIASNAQLRPETSDSVTVGLVWQPLRAVSVAADFFRIVRRGEIAARDINYVLKHEPQPEYARMVVRNPVSDTDRRLAARAAALDPGARASFSAGGIQALLLNYENAGRTLSSGIDVEVKGHARLGGWGSVTLGLMSTIGLRYQEWDIEAGTYRPNQVGLRGTPRYTTQLTAGWQRGPFNASMRVHHRSRTALNFNEIDAARWNEAGCREYLKPTPDLPCYLGGDTRTDWQLMYTGLDRTRLSLYVRNAFNQAAPVDLRGGYVPRPRTIKLGADYAF